MWRGHLRDYLPAKVRRVRSDECAGELFAPQGERLKVCLGHGREVGGVGVHGAARDEVGHGGREPLVLHAEVDVDESCDLGSLADAYREIGSVVGFEDVKKPITAQYAFFALGFAVIAALGAVMMAARWPR